MFKLHSHVIQFWYSYSQYPQLPNSHREKYHYYGMNNWSETVPCTKVPTLYLWCPYEYCALSASPPQMPLWRQVTVIASQITDHLIVYLPAYNVTVQYQREYQSAALLTLCEWNPLATDWFPSKRVSNAEKVPMSWRHHALPKYLQEVPRPKPMKMRSKELGQLPTSIGPISVQAWCIMAYLRRGSGQQHICSFG